MVACVLQHGLHAAHNTGHNFPKHAQRRQTAGADGGCKQRLHASAKLRMACSHVSPCLGKSSAAGCWNALHAEGGRTSCACAWKIDCSAGIYCEVSARSSGPKLLQHRLPL